MFGGLMFELLTGESPFYWLTTPELVDRRKHNGGDPYVPHAFARTDAEAEYGLRGVSVLDAAAVDGVRLPADTLGLHSLMAACLSARPEDRPSLDDVRLALQELAVPPVTSRSLSRQASLRSTGAADSEQH